ncbi:hypothetical protein [Actinomadura flavalba]|uniref:hypothetical protein n=1 Tax=Actinomadura flavalba TaxID=1120938 RepID=UPI000369DFF4|nr:hypothetical protein [Actinomadura flavalba]
MRRWVPLALWALLVAGAFVVGDVLRRAGIETEDALPPLHAHPQLPSAWIVPAVAGAAVAVAALPPLAARLPWRWLLPASWALAAGWAVVLAVADGPGSLTRPLEAPTEYPAAIGAVDADPGLWVRTFADRLYAYTTHVRGHPPLPTLVVWALDAVGLHGTGWSAALVIGAGASAVPAVALTLRVLTDESVARRALPFLVLAPLAVWVATSMDAFFLGVGAWGTAFLALATRSRAAWPWAVASGLLLGSLPYLSYGLLPLFAVPLVVLIVRRPAWPVWAALVCGLVVVPAAFTAAGFWWFDGVAATHETYLISRGSAQRTYAYFAVANVAVLALLTGPATAMALPETRRHRRSPLVWLAAAALVGTLALDLSGVTRGEVERIWLPFALWMVPLAVLHRPPARLLLAAQAVTALAIQGFVLSEW